jgi:uncharacterized membrane protein
MTNPPASNPPPAAGTTGLQENIAGLLAYLFGWVSGLILFLIDGRKFVRFHALQSIILTVVLMVVYFVLGIIPIIGWILMALLGIGFFILWIMLMMKAYQGQMWKLPVIGEYADKWSTK